MQYSFNCYGHKNITSKHKNTLEFTKDEEVSLRGDCIVGVKGDFLLKDLKKFIENKISQYEKNQLKNKTIEKLNNKSNKIKYNDKNYLMNKNNQLNNEKINNNLNNGILKDKIPIKIIIKINKVEEEINGFLNPDFNDKKEIVIRKSDFISERTLVIGANKGAFDLKKEFVEILKKPNSRVKVDIL